MEKYKLKKLQELEFDILKQFIEICDKYDLNYSLAYGTLIGAVRHNGFIPWDDDIDVAMSRADYDKFCKIMESQPLEGYFFQSYITEPQCGLIFSKIRKDNTVLSEIYSHHINMHQGVWIDIFPYDKVSNNKIKRKIDYLMFLVWKNMYIVKCDYNMPPNRSKIGYIFYYVVKFVNLFLSRRFLINKVEKSMTKYKNKSTDYVFSYADNNVEQKKFPSELLDHYCFLNFEGEKVKSFKEYDCYLRNNYGDYMILPPEDQRANGSGHFIKEFKSSLL